MKHIQLLQDGITIELSLTSFLPDKSQIAREEVIFKHVFPMQLKRRGHELKLVIGTVSNITVDSRWVKSISRSYAWAQEPCSGKAKSIKEIADREDVSINYIRRRLKLTFLSPAIIEAITAGNHPATLTTDALIKHIDFPLKRTEQELILKRI